MTKKEQKEVSEFLFAIMKGTIKDEILSKDQGELIEVPVPVATRMKAAELLFKAVNNEDKKESNLPVPVVIVEDI